MNDFILEVHGLRARYGHRQVLNGIDLALPRGAITTLLGANGAGKTTTLRALCHMVEIEGEVSFEGRVLGRMSTERIAQLGVAHVPDGRGTFLGLSVEENLYVGAYTRRNRKAVRQDIDRMYSYFPRLKERRFQQAGTLSGGEQQMLAISRALMLRPRLLLMDEPSFGLAPLVVREIFELMRKINLEDHVTIFLVEQNAAMTLEFADKVYLMETGVIVRSGSAESIKQDDNIRRAYLGH